MVFSQNEILLMIGVVSVLLICISILTILDIKEYLKAKKSGVIEETFGEEYVPSKKTLEPITVTLEDNKDTLILEDKSLKDEEVYFEDMEDENYEVTKEVNPIIEEDEEVYIPKVDIQKPQIVVDIPKVEVSEAKVEIETPKVEVETPVVEVHEEKKPLEVFEELEEIENNLPNKKDDITNFEAEQERTAIISLDELMKRSNELYNDNEVVQYDDGNEPISIDEVIKMFKKDEEPVVEEVKEVPEVFQEVVETKVPYSKKETIPFISSVYGIEKENNALEFENTATYEKLDRSKYNDFVSQLQEMNENK